MSQRPGRAGAAAGGVTDRGDHVLEVVIVEAAEDGLEIGGDAVGEGGGQPEYPVLAAAGGQLAAVERGDGLGPADRGHRGAVGEAVEGVDEVIEEVGPGQPVVEVDQQV